MNRVSCLMITLPVAERRSRMLRAIDDYVRQTHADRELIVVIDGAHGGDPRACASAIAALGRDDIRVILPAGAATLGALRNVAVASATGGFICQWDDDDRHHPDRIAAQAAAARASGCAATILQDVLLLHDAGRSLRWACWARTPAGGHPATLFCRREAMPAYPEIGTRAALGEDLAVLERLIGDGRVHPLPDRAHLYIYVDHGANASPAAHHAMLRRELAISSALLRRREAALRAGLAPFDLGDPPLTVEGRDGPAFMLASGERFP